MADDARVEPSEREAIGGDERESRATKGLGRIAGDESGPRRTDGAG